MTESTPPPDLRDALAEALHAAGIGCMMPVRVCEPSDPRYADFHPAMADAILAATPTASPTEKPAADLGGQHDDD